MDDVRKPRGKNPEIWNQLIYGPKKGVDATVDTTEYLSSVSARPT